MGDRAETRRAHNALALQQRAGFPVLATGEISCIVARSNLAELLDRVTQLEEALRQLRTYCGNCERTGRPPKLSVLLDIADVGSGGDA